MIHISLEFSFIHSLRNNQGWGVSEMTEERRFPTSWPVSTLVSTRARVRILLPCDPSMVSTQGEVWGTQSGLEPPSAQEESVNLEHDGGEIRANLGQNISKQLGKASPGHQGAGKPVTRRAKAILECRHQPGDTHFIPPFPIKHLYPPLCPDPTQKQFTPQPQKEKRSGGKDWRRQTHRTAGHAEPRLPSLGYSGTLLRPSCLLLPCAGLFRHLWL